ncbi:hypothetical protein [Rhodanobacter sp. C05]|uniref:hypothetical protein n=1 Tax=Rhodanobacter sp. C05 TaxID=1945855 RepID=UPI00117B1EED|nr:hypothetical protein [Rhodanobacter sp. C05]
MRHDARSLFLVIVIPVLVSGCTTLAGKMVSTHIYEMRVDGGNAVYSKPEHCSNPSYSVTYHPSDDAKLTLTDISGNGNIEFDVEITLKTNATFFFVSSSITASSSEWKKPINVPLPKFSSYQKNGTQIFPLSELTGPKENTPTATPSPYYTTHFFSSYTYSGTVDGNIDRVDELTINLPAAVVDGKHVEFGPIVLHDKKLTYFQSSCLR